MLAMQCTMAHLISNLLYVYSIDHRMPHSWPVYRAWKPATSGPTHRVVYNVRMNDEPAASLLFTYRMAMVPTNAMLP